jgi:MFS family permease
MNLLRTDQEAGGCSILCLRSEHAPGRASVAPLVVHAAVVLIPLTTLLVIAFGVVPGWRWLTRWPAAVASVGCVGLAFLATTSGESLLRSNPALRELVRQHEERAHLLARVLIPFAVLVLLSAWTLGGSSALASGRGERKSRIPAVARAFPPLLVLAAVGIIVLTVLVGDSGARAVWAGR